MTQHQKESFNNLYRLTFIMEEYSRNFLSYLQTHMDKFSIMEDTSLTTVDLDNQDKYYFPIWDEKNQGVMQVLFNLSELMKNENKIEELDFEGLTNSKMMDLLGSHRLINFTGERSSNNKMKQKIVYSSKIYKKVLVFIFNCQNP